MEALLFAYGDDEKPLPETVRLLDEIVTDYIIELCQEAAILASYSHRVKIKLDDFKFTLRKDPRKMGRVVEMLSKEKELKRQRRIIDDETAGAADDEDGKEGGGKRKKRKTAG